MAQWLARWIRVQSIERTKMVERSRVRFPWGPVTFSFALSFSFCFFWPKERIELRSSERWGKLGNRAVPPQKVVENWGTGRSSSESWGKLGNTAEQPAQQFVVERGGTALFWCGKRGKEGGQHVHLWRGENIINSTSSFNWNSIVLLSITSLLGNLITWAGGSMVSAVS